jgi:Xaa-Pro aminopeptidase
MSWLLLYGDTEHSAALRHEVPIAILDPFLFAEDRGHTWITASDLEAQRLAACRPDAKVIDIQQLGLHELLQRGRSHDEIALELASRAAARTPITEAIVDFDFPLAIADRLRADGIALRVDGHAVDSRRRRKSSGELAGIRRAQVAAEAAMKAAAALLDRAQPNQGSLRLDEAPLTAERVRTAMREAAWKHGTLLPPDVIVASVWQGVGHEAGFGALPAGLPIQIDLWPRDLESTCWADMTRTFLAGGEPPDEIRRQERVVRRALDDALAAIRPGVTGRELHDRSCDLFEAEGYRTQRTGPGDEPTDGFRFSLGHGVGLRVHEAPALGRTGNEPLWQVTCSRSSRACGDAIWAACGLRTWCW